MMCDIIYKVKEMLYKKRCHEKSIIKKYEQEIETEI